MNSPHTTLLALATAAVAGCTTQQVTPPPIVIALPTYPVSEPAIKPLGRPAEAISQRYWRTGDALVVCSESSIAVSTVPGSPPTAFNAYSSRTISCGANNPQANVSSVPATPLGTFSAVRTVSTGSYIDPASGLQCTGRVVMVDPNSGTAGQKMPPAIHGPAALREFGGFKIPAGYSVVMGVVRDADGNSHASDSRCSLPTIITRNVTGIPAVPPAPAQ